MKQYRIYSDNSANQKFNIDQKTKGLIDLAEMNINVPSFYIVPSDCFYTYRKLPNEDKPLYIKKIVRSFINFYSEIIPYDHYLISMRCPDKSINSKSYPYPETVLNIGCCLDDSKKIIDRYGYDFWNRTKEVFINHAESFIQYVGSDVFKDLLQMDFDEQLEYFISSLYKYFESIFDRYDDINFTFILQRMVFGDLDSRSLTGMCYTRNPYTGEMMDYGRYINNHQGISLGAVKSDKQLDLSLLKTSHKDIYDELKIIMDKVEKHYNDIRYLEYTVQSGNIYILQNTIGNRTYIL